MDIKKIGIASGLGFVAMSIIGGLTFSLFYQAHWETVAQKFPNVISFPPDMVIAMLGGVVYIFVMAVIFDKMGNAQNDKKYFFTSCLEFS